MDFNISWESTGRGRDSLFKEESAVQKLKASATESSVFAHMTLLNKLVGLCVLTLLWLCFEAKMDRRFNDLVYLFY